MAKLYVLIEILDQNMYRYLGTTADKEEAELFQKAYPTTEIIVANEEDKIPQIMFPIYDISYNIEIKEFTYIRLITSYDDAKYLVNKNRIGNIIRYHDRYEAYIQVEGYHSKDNVEVAKEMFFKLLEEYKEE